ncbi:uncharacterized protein [Antedon mediterranea]|uniref:uncharacterized protein n=1 Tax=Antedon mediterranea TaxID=105859 RepID=UPI003AF9E016
MNVNMLALLHLYIMLSLTISNVYTAPPVWSNCPSDIEQNTEPNSNQATVMWTVPTVTDDTTPLSGLVIQEIYNPALATPSVFLIGTTEVRYTATDTDTEVGSCDFNVTIVVPCSDFPCVPGTLPCVSDSSTCDGNIDCIDGADESMCLGLKPWNFASLISAGENDIILAFDGEYGAIYGGRLSNGTSELQTYYFNSTFEFSGIDYDPVLQEIYITDVANGQILKTPLSGESFTVVVSDINNPWSISIAIDPISRTIFWAAINSIESMQIDGSDRKTIITQISSGTNIAVLTSNRTLFWSGDSSIDRGTYEGRDKQRILDQLYGVESISLDVEGGWLYIVSDVLYDDGKSIIYRTDYWGNSMQNVHKTEPNIFNVFYYQDFIYYTSWDKDNIKKVKATINANISTPVTTKVFQDIELNFSQTGVIIMSYKDTENPVVTCPSDIITNSTDDTTTAGLTYNATSTDNVGIASESFNIPSGSIFESGETTVIFTALDSSGNQGTCSFTVTVEEPICAKKCSNGGTCMVNNGVEECQCATDFEGDNCENNESSSSSIEIAIGLFFAGIVIGLLVSAGVVFKHKWSIKKKSAENGFIDSSNPDAHTDTKELHEYMATIEPVGIDNNDTLYMTVEDTVEDYISTLM